MAMYDYVYEKDFKELSDWVKKTIPYSVTYGKFDVKKSIEDILKNSGPFEEDTTLWCKTSEDMYVPSMYTFLTSLAYIYSGISKNFSPVEHTHAIRDIDGLLANISRIYGALGSLGGFNSELTEFTVDHTHNIWDINDLSDAIFAIYIALSSLGSFNDELTNFTVEHTHKKSDITDFAHTHKKSDITDFAHTHTIENVTNLQAKIDSIENTLGYIKGQHIKVNNYQRFKTENGKTYLCALHVYYRARDGKYHSPDYGEGAIAMDILGGGAKMSARAQWASCVNTVSSLDDPSIKLYAAVNKRVTDKDGAMSFYEIPAKYNFSPQSRLKTVTKTNGTKTSMEHRSLRYYYNGSSTDNPSQDIYIVDLNTLDDAEKLELVCEITKTETSTTLNATSNIESKAALTNSVDSIEDTEEVVGIFTGNVDLSQYI